MNIKVCGITQFKQLQQLEALNIDYAGLIFYKDSPRYMGDKIPAAELKDADFDLKKVGVFVNPGYSEILDAIDDYGLDIVQLHGNESPEFCGELSEELEVIKAFQLKPGEDPDIDAMLKPYDEACDYYLFDTGGLKEGIGTNDHPFDWSILHKAKIEKPFFLGGSIGPADAGSIRAFRHPDFFAVDINTRFETAPGVKDMALLLKFTQAFKTR